MDKLKLLSTIFSKLESLTKNNGQIIISRDSKSLYVDLEGERIEITDWIDIDTEENLLAILTPLTNKYYYTKDNNKIWRYINNDWECLNTSVNDLTPTYTESSTLVKLSSGEKLSVAFGKISKAITDLISHISDSVKHITSAERSNWNAAKTHADSTHAPADAQKNVQSDWSATSGDAYIKNKPTEFPPSIHTHTKSEISDFPSSLPASGGNADTVNNHTVESDVPTDAVFTDTIYDDTEVKESIAELNSNLSMQNSDVFDGELLQGYYKDSDGGYLGNSAASGSYVCSKNYLQVIEGKKVIIDFGANYNSLSVNFYTENKTFISTSTGNGNKLIVDVPNSAKYFHFSFGGNAITPTSVPMPKAYILDEVVNNINESLSDYGLDNKFDGVWRQGYFDQYSGVWNTSPTDIATDNYISVKSGSNVRVIYDGTFAYLRCYYWNNDTYVGYVNLERGERDVNVTVPDNVNRIKFVVVAGVTVTPQTVGRLSVYVNNEIDQLKNDLEIINQVVVENGITFTFSKTGNVKQIIWEGSLINTVNAWDNLITIPVEFRPSQNHKFYFNDSYNSYKYYCNSTAIQPTADATHGTYAGKVTFI